jgi:hypothetical protein
MPSERQPHERHGNVVVASDAGRPANRTQGPPHTLDRPRTEHPFGAALTASWQIKTSAHIEDLFVVKPFRARSSMASPVLLAGPGRLVVGWLLVREWLTRKRSPGWARGSVPAERSGAGAGVGLERLVRRCW